MGQIADLYEYFQDFIVDRDMHYVANNLIKPLTRDCKKSYAELIGPKTVEWFVSHYWGQEFLFVFLWRGELFGVLYLLGLASVDELAAV